MDHDTKALLLECGAGVQMAVGAIDDVLGQTRDKKLEQALLSCREAHKALGQQTKALLDAEHIAECPGSKRARSSPSLPPTKRSQTLSPTAATWASSPSSATATATRTRAKPPVKSRASSSTLSRRSVSPCRLTCNLHNFLARRQKIFHCAFFPRGV